MKKSIGPKTILAAVPVLLIGSYDEQQRPNLMTCAWGGICCSSPPCVNISLRKATYSYHNILSRGAFTINVPFSHQIKEADFFGIVSGKDYDKFKKANITPEKSEFVDAPYGKEFPMVLECKVIHQIEIGLHTEFIGEIVDLKVDQDLLDEHGKLIGEKLDPILYIPEIREYYTRGKCIGKGYTAGRDLTL